MKLPPRLEYVFSFTKNSRLTADVGTDHGKLAAALLISGRAERVVACDVNAGPLAKARELIEKLGLSDRAELRLADGLKGLEGRRVDQAVIAGMGGELIASIISAAPWVAERGVRLVLQPMTTAPELRGYLYGAGFFIEREGAVVEDGKPYEVITARWDGIKRVCSPEEAEIGGGFEGEPDAVRALLTKKRSALGKRLIGAQRQNGEDAVVIRRLIEELDKRLEEL